MNSLSSIWLMGKAADSQSTGQGFDLQPFHWHVRTLTSLPQTPSSILLLLLLLNLYSAISHEWAL